MKYAGLDRAYQVIVSVFVAFVLIFQAIISFGPIVGIEIGTRYWPLVNYAMYSRSFSDGDTVDIYKLLEGVTEDGRVVEISMDMLGMNIWHYRDFVRDLEKGRAEATSFLLRSVSDEYSLVSLRIRTFPIAVTRAGPREQPSEIISVLQLPERVE